MATAKKTTTAAKSATKPAKSVTPPQDETIDQSKVTGRAVVDWEEQMRLDAEASQKMEESTATGAFFSTKSGILSWNETDLADNQIICVIADSILMNIYHEDAYDEDNRAPPVCFAFARLETDLAPHENVFAAGQNQNDVCAGCEHNKFGTAEVGKGKACKNKRRLALIPYGHLDEKTKKLVPPKDGELDTATMGFLQLPVTSVKPYSAYVKQLTGSMKRPPHGVITKIKVIPDKKTQFAVTFELMGLVPNNHMPAVMLRNQEAKAGIMQPPSLERDDPPAAPAKGTRGKPAAKKTATKRKF